MRADAQRNLTAILRAARESFAAGGLEVGVADIARRAGVGTATIFRRFATKDDLICAVCEQAIDQFQERVEAAERDPDPWHGLRSVIVAAVEIQVEDRGLCEALNRGMDTDPRLRARQDGLIERMSVVLRRAQESGDVRADLEPVDLPIVVAAVARIGHDLEPIAPGAWRRYLDLLFAALRPGGPPLTVSAISGEQLASEPASADAPR